MDRGVDLEADGPKGTPLQLVASYPRFNFDILRALLDAGSDANQIVDDSHGLRLLGSFRPGLRRAYLFRGGVARHVPIRPAVGPSIPRRA